MIGGDWAEKRAGAPMWQWVALLYVVLFVAMALLGYTYTRALQGIQRVESADLVYTQMQQTKFKYPQQRYDYSNGKYLIYGNDIGNNKSSVTLTILESPTADITRLQTTHASKSTQEEVRAWYAGELEKWSDNLANCPSPKVVSSQKLEGLIGKTTKLYEFQVECQRTKTAYIFSRFVLGDDGRLRTAILDVDAVDWQRNSAAYKEMLDSLEQV